MHHIHFAFRMESSVFFEAIKHEQYFAIFNHVRCRDMSEMFDELWS